MLVNGKKTGMNIHAGPLSLSFSTRYFVAVALASSAAFFAAAMGHPPALFAQAAVLVVTTVFAQHDVLVVAVPLQQTFAAAPSAGLAGTASCAIANPAAIINTTTIPATVFFI